MFDYYFIILMFFFILLLTMNMFKGRQNFIINECLGKRDGVSGCRDCCSKQNKNYYECVYHCMNY